jgi:methylenetetrahydrofolate--tRNA-(uracil-5-)-methyltransferase
MGGVRIIGGGLAGSEAAWQLASRGIDVSLYEMRPGRMTPAHSTGLLSELVCSNSLKSEDLSNAAGLLKAEMRMMGSLTMQAADKARVPAGAALAVDRAEFATSVTAALEQHPRVHIFREEFADVDPSDDTVTIIATGPLTSESLISSIKALTGAEYLYFYDAAAPIVSAESLDMSRLFWGSRWGKGESDYLNAPMTKEEYEAFWHALVTAERHPLKQFEKEVFFEACMPVEELARRGKDTLAFGPLKPVGLMPPGWSNRPYAVVQLRIDNRERTLFNLVGFQTNLRWGEQDRVFRMIPGLENAEFVRYGVMHRNVYIDSPSVLLSTAQMRCYPHILIAGQLSGVEGYLESAASGILSGINASRLVRGQPAVSLPDTTMLGALMRYISDEGKQAFQPMHASFGLLPSSDVKGGRKQKRQAQATESLRTLGAFLSEHGLVLPNASCHLGQMPQPEEGS